MSTINPLDTTLSKLGDGLVETLKNSDIIFKLHSYSENPILQPEKYQQMWYEDSKLHYGAIFNAGAILYDNKVILIPRAQKEYQRGRFFDETLNIFKFHFNNYISKIWILISDDGLNFQRYNQGVIRGDGSDHNDFFYGIEDARIIEIDSKFWIIGCGKVLPAFQSKPGISGDRIAIYSTQDFKTITYHGIVNDMDVRNVVLFPEKISNKQYILLRLDNQIQIDVLEDGLSLLENPVKYEDKWQKLYSNRKNSLLLESGSFSHEQEKIGPGPPPYKTSKGWLLIYHAVGKIDTVITESYNLPQEIPRAYSICAALLDLQDPSIVLCRTKYPLYIPSHPYELYGNLVHPIDVPAVTFPMGLIVKNDKLMLYCGSGDKYIILLSTKLSTLLHYLWNECKI